MVIDMKYWNKILKKIIYFVCLILLIFIVLKLACFFMPFIVALIIANMIEPMVRFINKKFKLIRKTSAIISIVLVFVFLVGVIIASSVVIVSEVSNLLKNFETFGNNIFHNVETFSNFLKLEDVNVSDDVKNLIIDATNDLLAHVLDYIKNFLIDILNLITQIPIFVIYLVITILATYFISTDRLGILDDLEQKIPKRWIRKANKYFKSTVSVLGKYLKAELILIFISFIEVLIGLYIFKMIGLNVKSPFLIALGIGFVDLLPILGSGTVMLPWGVIEIIMGNVELGLAVIGLLIFISLVRQFLEPKIVSSHLGIHPLYTLISMYIGFKISGVLGLLIGPIVLIIILNFFNENNKRFSLVVNEDEGEDG